MFKFDYPKYNPPGAYFREGLYMEGVFRFKSWFLNAPGLIHGGAYYRNFTVFQENVDLTHWKVWTHVSQCLYMVDPKDCCWLWLTFRQPVWKLSSEARMTSTQVVKTSFTTNNSPSQKYTTPNDQKTTTEQRLTCEKINTPDRKVWRLP